jgi:glutaconate CoA-transferase subunit A
VEVIAKSKLVSLPEAIGRFVTDGCSVALGLCLEALIPFAAGHEIIRQQKRGLTLIGPISDILFDQLIGAGCASRVQAAWVGNVITGSGYNFRRAVEARRVAVEDHSNLTLAMALKAGALGVPFLPVRSALGSDLLRTNSGLTPITCPFSGDSLAAVGAIRPDVAIIQAQRCDEQGNAHVWGNLGVVRDACLAARQVIVCAEEIATSEVITRDPNRVITPGFRVSAVAHTPWGGHPSAVPGYYNRDHQAFLDYRDASRSAESFAQWRQQWVEAARDLEGYLRLLGPERLEALRLQHHLYSEPVDYGY